jgi:prohibitin 1
MNVNKMNQTKVDAWDAFFTKAKKYGRNAAIGFAVFVVLMGSFSTVGPGERGVMVTLGKTGDSVLGEGPHFKFPFISSIRTMSIRVQKSQDKTEAATKDLQRVTATVALNWTINPESVGKMLREVGTEESIEVNIINPAVSEVLKASTAKMTAEEVLTKRMELKHSIDEMLIKRLTSYGLIVKDISLVDLDFTREFNHAVEAKQIAEQEAKQAEYNAQKAAQDAKAAVNKAKGEAESNIALANAEAKSSLVKSRAQAEGQKLLKQTLTKDVLQLEYLRKWNGQLPSVLTGNGNGVMLNVPTQTSETESDEE